jgi:hypothetical protein
MKYLLVELTDKTKLILACKIVGDRVKTIDELNDFPLSNSLLFDTIDEISSYINNKN